VARTDAEIVLASVGLLFLAGVCPLWRLQLDDL
jgi:hypothetical protein